MIYLQTVNRGRGWEQEEEWCYEGGRAGRKRGEGGGASLGALHFGEEEEGGGEGEVGESDGGDVDSWVTESECDRPAGKIECKYEQFLALNPRFLSGGEEYRE